VAGTDGDDAPLDPDECDRHDADDGGRWPHEPGGDGSWPDEPDEFDPTALGPNVEIPQAPDMTETDATVDPAVERLFWKLVVTFNIAVFAVSVGPMLIVFRGQWQDGGIVFAIGALTFAYGVVTYRRYRAGTLLDDDDGTAGDDRNG